MVKNDKTVAWYPVKFGCIHQKQKYETKERVKGKPVGSTYMEPCWDCADWISEIERFSAESLIPIREKRAKRKIGYSEKTCRDCPKYSFYTSSCQLLTEKLGKQIWVKSEHHCAELPRLLREAVLGERVKFQEWYEKRISESPELTYKEVMVYEKELEKQENISMNDRKEQERYLKFLKKKVGRKS